MASRFETLIVFPTNRGDYILQDQVEAIHWAHDRSHLIVVVDDTMPVDAPPHRGGPDATSSHHVIPSRLPKGQKQLSGFKAQEGIKWAIEAGYEFAAVLCLDDDALPIGRGLDAWALPFIERTAIDLLGVEDRCSYQDQWEEVPEVLGEWLPEARDVHWVTDLMPQNVFYAVTWLSWSLAMTLHARDLLVPYGCEHWPYWPDVYISWVAQLTGHYVVTWGHMDAPRAPLYANHANHMRFAPDPRILRDDFLIFHPVRQVTAADEETLRRHYASVRAGGSDRPGPASRSGPADSRP